MFLTRQMSIKALVERRLADPWEMHGQVQHSEDSVPLPPLSRVLLANKEPF